MGCDHGPVALLERDGLLSTLRSWASRASGGSGGLVAIAGEPGAGKTALVRAFSDSNAVGVRFGWCDPLSTPRPLGPVHDLTDDPEVLTAAGAGDGPAVRDGLLRTLRERASIFVIEDAHWADAATVDLLRHLGRRIASTPSLLVVTYRDTLAADNLWLRALDDLIREPAVARIVVPPLSREAVRTLAGERADEVYTLTAGNAFLVTEVLGAWPHEPGDAQGDADVSSESVLADAVLPDTVLAAARGQLAQLSAEARDLVELLAVTPGWSACATYSSEALDVAATAGLLEVIDGRVGFRHELLRTAVESTLAPGRKVELHRAVLASLPEDAWAQRAHHSRSAGETVLAITCALAAGDEASRIGSHREAAQHYAAAIQLGGTEYATWRKLSFEQFTLGFVEADDSAQRAIDVAEDALQRGDALRWRSRVAPNASQRLELLERALEVLEPLGPTPELVAAYAQQSFEHMLNRDLTDSIEWAERALALASSSDIESSVMALQASGCASLLRGDAAGADLLRRAEAISMMHHRETDAARSWANLVSAAGEARMHELALAAYADAEDFFAARDLDAGRDYTYAWHARVLLETGRWDEAARAAARCEHSHVAARVTALQVLGRLRARRGDPGAWSALDEAHTLAGSTGLLQRTAPVLAARAEARWLEGNPGSGGDDLEGALALACETHDPWAIGELAVWMRRNDIAFGSSEGAATPYALLLANRLREASQEWTRLGCPYEAADALADSDDVDDLDEALAIFHQLGARPAAERVARRLRERGVQRVARGTRASTKADPHGLTPREQEVLQLLRRSHTDLEIATRLYLSPKTVGHHVSSILHKLGVSSRRELRDAI